jgi:DNA (cytosine-5)-methyltransferase 1
MRLAPLPLDERGRLSPTFVEWMMGFPEGWTAGLSRTAALKALGNAVVPQQGVLALTTLLRTLGEAAELPRERN